MKRNLQAAAKHCCFGDGLTSSSTSLPAASRTFHMVTQYENPSLSCLSLSHQLEYKILEVKRCLFTCDPSLQRYADLNDHSRSGGVNDWQLPTVSPETRLTVYTRVWCPSAHLAVAHLQPRNTGNEDNVLCPTFCLLTWHSKVHQRKRQARKECKIPRTEVVPTQETTEGQGVHTWETSAFYPSCEIGRILHTTTGIRVTKDAK